MPLLRETEQASLAIFDCDVGFRYERDQTCSEIDIEKGSP